MPIKVPPAVPASLSRASRKIQVKDGPNLEYFLTRARVLSLYREIQRTLKDIKDPRDRNDLQTWARSDFEHYRHEKNPDKIKSLISQGKHQFHALQTNLSLSSGIVPKNGKK
ncbi:hypothetical protein BGZ70_007047 [Mortierella alpina]|uniref:LYR motif-containing protein 2 n=1 Tax=Mortierella alpina TaxID=64518 RepID=A0A9P6M6R0_MORAP|nr:hypothetical protein BGZ70_007047 [Mortierella alpina]